jgi:hypothetical protein
MEGKIVTDICVLAFFMTLIVLRKYLFTEGFLEFLKKYWIWLSAIIVGTVFILGDILEFKRTFSGISDTISDARYSGFIFLICAFLIVYFFLYGYFSVHISSLRNRRGIWKKWQIIYVPIAPLLPIYRTYEYFVTGRYNILDVVIFVFFIGTVIYVSHFLLKETFFSKEKSE